MRRTVGAALIFGGCLVLIVETRPLDDVIASLSLDRGIRVSDVLGLLIVAAGTAVLWRR